jgi:hypothetical protein
VSTYFKYKEREDPTKTQIDWASVTGKISEGIDAERTRRMDLKDELNKNYVDNLNTLETYSQGLDASRNQQIQGYANNYRDFIHEQNKLLKRGKITPSQYRLINQGAMDTFSNLNTAAQNFNDGLSKFVESGGAINEYMAENLAGLADLKNKQMIIDPVTGMGSLAELDEDGKVKEGTIVPIQKMGEMLNSQYPQFDMSAAVTEATKNAGVWAEAASAYNSVSDLRQNPEYNNWLDGRAKSIMAQSMDGVLVAADYLGYEITNNRAEAEANPNEFLYANNKGGVPTFEFVNDNQKGKVLDAIKSEIEVAIDRKVTKTAVSASTQKLWGDEKKKKQAYNLIVDSLKGDERALRTLAREAGYTGASINEGQLTFTDDKGNSVAGISLDGDINSVGSEIAGQLGLGGEGFNNFYTKGDLVETGAMNNFQDFTAPPAKVNVASADNLKSVYQPNYQIEDEETGRKIVEKRTKEEIIAIAKQQSGPILQEAGITGVTINDANGDVFYKGKKMGNAATGSEWVTNVQNEFNQNPQGEKTLDLSGKW